MSARRVIVTTHAVDRLAQRVSSPPDPVGHVFFEVQQAFRDGRTSKRIPRWAVSDGRDRVRSRNREVRRFAWNEGCTACYVLVWAASDGDGRRSWIVVTTLGATVEAAA